MSTWAVIPAKSLGAAKSRLAEVLTPGERATLARDLLRRTVAVARACPLLANVIVVSADPVARQVAEEQGALTLPDPPPGVLARDPLNAAIMAGRDRAVARGARAILVLPADLPLLTAPTLTAFIERAGDASVAIAPDWSGTGTNALLLRPPRAIEPAFGLDSYSYHRAAARARGFDAVTAVLPALARDLDTPDDLAAVGGAIPSLLEICHD